MFGLTHFFDNPVGGSAHGLAEGSSGSAMGMGRSASRPPTRSLARSPTRSACPARTMLPSVLTSTAAPRHRSRPAAWVWSRSHCTPSGSRMSRSGRSWVGMPFASSRPLSPIDERYRVTVGRRGESHRLGVGEEFCWKSGRARVTWVACLLLTRPLARPPFSWSFRPVWARLDSRTSRCASLAGDRSSSACGSAW